MRLDAFESTYADFLDERYDCVDRIILNGYFRSGSSPGGFRNWWRSLHGSDDNLDNAHLMRMAGHFSRCVRGWARKAKIPILDCSSGERKHDLAEQHQPSVAGKVGIFLVLVNRAPASIWNVVRYGEKGLDLRRKKGFVNHYTFHIWDAEWGHVAIRMCGHPPFAAMIMLNGHEWVAADCQQRGIAFRKEGNCFTEFADAPGLRLVADTLRSQDAIGRLQQVCERWLSSCLCFALRSEDQKRTNFRYDLSIYQAEYSRNYLFQRGRALDEVFQGLIDRTRATLDVRKVKTILGVKQRPQQKGKTRWEITVETPEYDLTIFKVHAGALTLKIYSKGERVLRCEIMLHNARRLKFGVSLEKWPQVMEHLRGVLERFVEVLCCADEALIDEATFESLGQSASVGQSRVAGLHLHSERLGIVLDSVLALATQPGGFTSGELAEQVRQRLRSEPEKYQARHASYDLEKLRGQKLVERIGQSRRYQSSPDGLRTTVALLIIKDKVFKPVLHNRNLQGPPPRNGNAVDHHYHNLRQEMRRLFQTLKIAA